MMDMALLSMPTKSHFVAFTAVFTAMITVLDVLPTLGFYSGIWDSWIFLLSPLVGILLGPLAGAFCVGLGSLMGHMIIFRNPFELVFMFGAPLGAAMSGLVYQRRWRPVLGIYSALLLGYFITPVAWILPLWGIWDILAGYGLLLLFVFLVTQLKWFETNNHKQTLRLIFSSVIGLEADILLRVFILVPGQTYWLFYGMTPEMLQLVWLGAGFVTPIKVVMAAIAVVVIGTALLRHNLSSLGSEELESIEPHEQ